MSSLSIFPEPPPVGYITICEKDSVLLAFSSSDSVGKTFTEAVSHYPKVVIPSDNRGLFNRECSRSAFLPHTETTMRRIITAWHEGGVFGLLGELTSNQKGMTGICIGWTAKTMMTVIRLMYSLQGSLYSHLSLSSEEMVSKFSPVASWQSGAIRALAWHPHVTKFAVCLLDDSIRVYAVGNEITPLLKHMRQRCVSDLAWRPNSASDLAVACVSCVLVWHIDPTSLVSKPSGNCVQILSQSGHGPVTSIQWSPDGKLLITASAADTSIIVWDVAMETQTPINFIGGGGVSLIRWSPDGSKVFSATPSTVFRVWQCVSWTSEQWNTMTYVSAACWSPDGSVLLFARSEEPTIYSLSFQEGKVEVVGGSTAALPVVNTTESLFQMPAESVSVGGCIQNMVWNNTGERLAVSFIKRETDKVLQSHSMIALFRTRIKPTLEISPCGFIRGDRGDSPQMMAFQQNFSQGALLTVGWSTGKITHIPMYFFPFSPAHPANGLSFHDITACVTPKTAVLFSRPSEDISFDR